MRLLHRGQRGFTLVEVLITISLLGFIALAFFSFMSAAASSLIHADERTIAESLARSQMEYVKNQGYNPDTDEHGQATYVKIQNIPSGYTLESVNYDGTAAEDIVGIVWDSDNNKPVVPGTGEGLQMIALVIKHEAAGEDKTIYTFINNSPNWPGGDGVPMTLQGYVRASEE
jgi:prepilin-type N-terminal cleavage/methylation domain-containing protein